MTKFRPTLCSVGFVIQLCNYAGLKLENCKMDTCVNLNQCACLRHLRLFLKICQCVFEQKLDCMIHQITLNYMFVCDITFSETWALINDKIVEYKPGSSMWKGLKCHHSNQHYTRRRQLVDVGENNWHDTLHYLHSSYWRTTADCLHGRCHHLWEPHPGSLKKNSMSMSSPKGPLNLVCFSFCFQNIPCIYVNDIVSMSTLCN